MSALATIAGADVLRASVELPDRGAWTAEVRVANETPPAGAVTLAFSGGLSLSGTVRRAGADPYGASVAFLVGGADGLRAPVSQHFERAFARDVLGVIARASGETLATDIATAIGSVQFDRYTLAGDCTGALDTLAAALAQSLGYAVTWRVRPDGALWIGADSWPAVTLPAGDALDTSYPALGIYVFAVATPTITPGVALADAGHVESVRHWLHADGCRSWVTVETKSMGGEFLRASRAALGLRAADPRQLWRYGTFRGRVQAQAADLSTVDVTFDGDVMPPAQRVPVRYHAGLKVQFGTGDAVEIGWDGGAPDRIFARPVSDGITPVKIIISATSKVYLGGDIGTAKLVRVTDYDGHAHAAGTLMCPNTGTGNPVAITGSTAGAAAATGTTITEAK